MLESSSYSCLPSFKHSRSPAAVVKLQYSINMASEGALTFRAVAAGLAVGAVLCFSNMYFGLQTGWVTMGSLQSAILGKHMLSDIAYITSADQPHILE